MPKPALILDCDPGHDDAVAILAAATYGDLLGITTVSGNVNLSLTTHNALITTQILELDVPVHAGAARPLVAEPHHAEFIHGETGLGGPVLPERTRDVASDDAVRFIIDTVRARDDVWLIATGPLTNVALALRTAPDIVERLQGISIMGGSTSFGNVTPAAEFNILFDPEAADIVFRSGAKLRMCGLNLTHQFLYRPADTAQIRRIDSRASTFVADMLDFFMQMYADAFFGVIEGPLHDPCAVLAVTHPELFDMRQKQVMVELKGQHTRGMTLVDERGVLKSSTPNASVAYGIDDAKARQLLLDAIRQYP